MIGLAGRHSSQDCRTLQTLFLFEIHLLLILPVIKVITLGHLLFALMKTVLNLTNSICVCLNSSSNKVWNFYSAAGTIFLASLKTQ